MFYAEARKTGSDDVFTARGTTEERAAINAIRRAGSSYRDIATWQHFPGGPTYHVQLGKYERRLGGTVCDDVYVVHIEER